MASKTKSAKKGKGAGRKARYQAYKANNTRAINKLKKHARHIKKHPTDVQKVGTVPNYKVDNTEYRWAFGDAKMSPNGMIL